MAALPAMAMLLSSAQAQTTQAQTTQSFPIALNRLSYTAPVWVAIERGYFRDVGLDVDVKLFEASNDAVLAVTSGSVDLTMAGNGAELFNVAAKGSVKIIGSALSETPGYHNSAAVESNALYEAGHRSIADLKGKRVGNTTAGSGTQYMWHLLADKFGYSINDLTVINLQSTQNIIAALTGGQIDAGIVGPPFPLTLEAQNKGHIVAWVGDETPYQINSIMVNADVLAKRRPQVAAYMQALSKGVDDVNKAFSTRDSSGNLVKGPGYDDILKLVSDKISVPPEQLSKTMPYLTPDLRLDLVDLDKQIQFWKDAGAVGRGLDPNSIVDSSFSSKGK